MTTTSEYRAIVTISLMASFADGAKNDREREKLAEVLNGLGAADLNLSGVYHDVLMKKTNLEQACADLTTPEMRQLAYEMAVAMCDADGSTGEAERAFLNDLAARLGLPQTAAVAVVAQADAVASISPPPLPETAAQPASDAAIEPMIIRYSILTGALELLPQSLASLAILPLQVKMVYRIGRHFGFTLDAGHIKEFIATLGLGMTGQMLDGMARKLLGGLAKKMAGGLVGNVARGATSAGVTFATTWAIGQVARQYYASGRRFDTGQLRALFGSLKTQGEKVYQQYAGDVQQRAGNLDLSQVMSGKLDAP
ncbi:MAG TPA: DUF533 domain-containing protein [Kiritimatiellia bacterium]|nr:DUF533 domain-containing protein [Kiritimatiellia bacterium]HMO97519.1 DUF533 domain-containing protein [Kiritimatiellia bacterium]